MASEQMRGDISGLNDKHEETPGVNVRHDEHGTHVNISGEHDNWDDTSGVNDKHENTIRRETPHDGVMYTAKSQNVQTSNKKATRRYTADVGTKPDINKSTDYELLRGQHLALFPRKQET